MVAKLTSEATLESLGYLLAKIHMVAKPCATVAYIALCYLLAKIHMVAKLPCQQLKVF